MLKATFLVALLVVRSSSAQPAVELVGERMLWHKLTLVFDGPTGLSEANPATFTDYRLDVTFKSGSKTYAVPGYYAADGQAADSGASDGNIWHCHFTPTERGTWNWSASFKKGPNVARSGGGTSGGPIDGLSGSFAITETNKRGVDSRRRGMLQYVGKHHLRWAGTGEYFLKTGADSPENLFAFDDFDGTPDNKGLRKDYNAHVSDWKAGDPTWRGGRGKGLIGAVNYLAEMGMNAMSFLTMNIGGDDTNVFPYPAEGSFNTFDVSKLAQWEIVMEHMDSKGIYLHFKLMEIENDNLLSFDELQLYYREICARFSHHLALNWNIGEENKNSHSDRTKFGNLMRGLDPYEHNIVIHNQPRLQSNVYEPILSDIKDGTLTAYTGASLQTVSGESVHSQTLEWLKKSEEAGRPWVVASDEIGPADSGILPDSKTPDNHMGEREYTLYGNIMAGGGGCESYFGYNFENSDLTLQDFRSRNDWWKQQNIAREFFEKYTPFWEMTSMDELAGGKAWVFGKKGSIYALYLPQSLEVELNLVADSNNYAISWYDPTSGGELEQGSLDCVDGGKTSSVGVPPANSGDWIALMTAGCGDRPESLPPAPTSSFTSGPVATLEPAQTAEPSAIASESPTSEVPEPLPPSKVPTTTEGSQCFGENEGTVVIQTDETKLTGDWEKGNMYSHTGNGYICHTGGNEYNFEGKGELEYTVDATGGDYLVYGTVLRPQAPLRWDEGNDFYVIDGNQPTKLYANMGDLFDEWVVTAQFDVDGEKSEPIISLPPGRSTFRIAARSEGLCIDYIELVKVGNIRKGTGEVTRTNCGVSTESIAPSAAPTLVPVSTETVLPSETPLVTTIEPTGDGPRTPETPTPLSPVDGTTPQAPTKQPQSDEFCFAERNGNIAIQAEMAELTEGWEEMDTLQGYTGDSFITYLGSTQEPFAEKSVLRYKIFSEAGGKYKVFPRGARMTQYRDSESDTDNNDFWIMDENSSPVKTVSDFRGASDEWVTNVTFYRGNQGTELELSIPAGLSYFVVAARSNAYSLDAVLLVREGAERSLDLSPKPC